MSPQSSQEFLRNKDTHKHTKVWKFTLITAFVVTHVIWQNCISMTNNRCFWLIVIIYLNYFLTFSSCHRCLHGFPLAKAHLGTNDKEARSYFLNGGEAQLLGCVAPSDHNQCISSMTSARECLAIYFKTRSKLELMLLWCWGHPWLSHFRYGWFEVRNGWLLNTPHMLDIWTGKRGSGEHNSVTGFECVFLKRNFGTYHTFIIGFEV